MPVSLSDEAHALLLRLSLPHWRLPSAFRSLRPETAHSRHCGGRGSPSRGSKLPSTLLLAPEYLLSLFGNAVVTGVCVGTRAMFFFLFLPAVSGLVTTTGLLGFVCNLCFMKRWVHLGVLQQDRVCCWFIVDGGARFFRGLMLEQVLVSSRELPRNIVFLLPHGTRLFNLGVLGD